MKMSTPIRFLFVGAFNFAFGYGIFALFWWLFAQAWPDWLIIAVTTIIGITESFLAHRFVTYRSHGCWWREYLRFYAVYGIQTAVNMCIIRFFVTNLGWDAYVVQFVTLVLLTFATYWAHKCYSFSQHSIKEVEMSVMMAIHKVRVWGISGIRDYVTKKYGWWRMGRELRRVARLDADAVPIRGITLIGEFKLGFSNSKTNRDFAHALKDAGIPFQTYSVDRDCTIPEKDYADILTPKSEFRLHKYTHVIEMFRSPLPRELVKNRARIAFWEGEYGMYDVWPFLRGKDPLIGMSDFNVDYFRMNPDGAPVYKILYPLRRIDVPIPPIAEVRQRFGFGLEDFVVFFNFDFGSYGRKNPIAAMKAFAQALKGVPKCRLVFKVQGVKSHQKEMDEIRCAAETVGIAAQFQIISEYLPHELLYGLTAACDVYISLHRGEGFGIGMAEAMLFGKPVVATNWSANTEFCVEGAAIPVPYRLVPVTPGGYFTVMREWAEADVSAAAMALRRLYDDPAYRAKIGSEAKRFINEHFSISRFKASVEAFLDN